MTSLPLSLAFPDGTMRQGAKSVFREHLLNSKKVSAKLHSVPKNARWIYDGMRLFITTKPQKNYKEYFRNILKAATPPFGSQPLQIEIINDQYFACSPKNGTRLSKGSGCVSKRVHLESVDQHMLQGGQWKSFFHNGSN